MGPKFTKGPWERYETGSASRRTRRIGVPLVGGGFRPVCQIESGNSEATKAEANAHLIAAAPELYDALQAMDDAMCGDFESREGRMAGRKALIAARAARAKARGEAS